MKMMSLILLSFLVSIYSFAGHDKCQVNGQEDEVAVNLYFDTPTATVHGLEFIDLVNPSMNVKYGDIRHSMKKFKNSRSATFLGTYSHSSEEILETGILNLTIKNDNPKRAFGSFLKVKNRSITVFYLDCEHES